MKKLKILFSFCVLTFLSTLYAEDPETLVRGGYDQKEMDAAIARARKELETFIKELHIGDAAGYSVKVPIKDGEDVEHFWLTEVKFIDGFFEGLIGNEPGIVKNVKYGQKWKVKKNNITDWMIFKDEKIYGGYTIDPLLVTMQKKEADAMREILVR